MGRKSIESEFQQSIDPVQVRARCWLFFSYVVAFGSVAGAVAVLLRTTGSGDHIQVGVVSPLMFSYTPIPSPHRSPRCGDFRSQSIRKAARFSESIHTPQSPWLAVIRGLCSRRRIEHLLQHVMNRGHLDVHPPCHCKQISIIEDVSLYLWDETLAEAYIPMSLMEGGS